MAVTNQSLLDYLQTQEIPISSTQNAIQALFEWLKSSDADIDQDALRVQITNYMSHLSDKWSECSRNYNQLTTRFHSWATNEFRLPIKEDSVTPETDTANPPCSSKVGRPSVSILAGSTRSKRRKIKSKYGETESAELLLAAQSRLFADGKRNQANVIALASTSEGAEQILDCMKKAEKFDSIRPFSPEEALTMLLDCETTKNAYRAQRKAINTRLGFDFIPSYEKVVAEKNKCYPENIEIEAEDVLFEGYENCECVLDEPDSCHQLVKTKFRRRCANCYKNIRQQNGRPDACNKTPKTFKECNKCMKYYCDKCFFELHKSYK